MDNKETFGDFTVMDGVISQLTGDSMGSLGGRDFPVMDPPEDDDDELDAPERKASVTTEGFSDERTVEEGSIPGITVKNPDTITDDDEEETIEEDEETIEETKVVEDEKPVVKTEENTDEVLDTLPELGDAEPEIAALMQEKLFEKLGWDIEEGEEFKEIGEVVDYMEKIVEASSKPKFASDDIEALNKFVTDGGNVRDFFQTQGSLDLDNLDLEVEFNQKAVVKEFLKEEGYSDSQINKKVNRYDESGILEDEAIEAKESLEKVRKVKADRLLKDQAILQKQTLEQQQKFYDDVSSTIDKIDNVRGVPLTKTEKNQLKDALLKVGKDGKTSYQKSYQNDFITNFIESGFFTMKKNTLIKDMQKQAESKATRNLKKKLQQQTKRGRSTGAFSDEQGGTDSGHNVLNNLFGSFTKP